MSAGETLAHRSGAETEDCHVGDAGGTGPQPPQLGPEERAQQDAVTPPGFRGHRLPWGEGQAAGQPLDWVHVLVGRRTVSLCSTRFLNTAFPLFADIKTLHLGSRCPRKPACTPGVRCGGRTQRRPRSASRDGARLSCCPQPRPVVPLGAGGHREPWLHL